MIVNYSGWGVRWKSLAKYGPLGVTRREVSRRFEKGFKGSQNDREMIVYKDQDGAQDSSPQPLPQNSALAAPPNLTSQHTHPPP